MTSPRFTRHIHKTRIWDEGDIEEGIEVGNTDGICYKCPVKKTFLKNGNQTNDLLEATFLVVNDGATIETVAQIYGIPITSLWDHVTKKTIGRKCGKSRVLSFDEGSELVTFILKMQRLGHPINLSQCRLKVVEIT